MKKSYYLLLILSVIYSVNAFGQAKFSGELKKWHKVTLNFEGPETSEMDDYNPFMNYRLNVTFTHSASGVVYVVPGYYAADGNAANTSAASGNVWRVHFSPDQTGKWTYKVDFRKGRWVAVSDRDNPGESAEYMDGEEGAFEIGRPDKSGDDFRARGRLIYIGEHFLKLAESGEYFLKNGVDAPENLLAYEDFDGTFHDDGHKDDLVKTWDPHIQDWDQTDPAWKDGKGKGLIGALNYLKSEGLNSVSFLTLSIKGDDHNVFPYIDYDTYDRFDISKLDQWEIIFEHAQKNGIFLHFKTQEAENQGLLDNGGVGAMRKLYYRELIARFGHHLALNWNLGEENGDWVKNHRTPPQFTCQRLSMAEYFHNHDPYKHHIVIHNGNPFYDLLGPDSKLTGPSVQTHHSDFRLVHNQVIKWRRESEEAGKKWAVSVDEPGDAQHALVPDKDDPEHNLARQNALWGAYMAGAWGIEWYFGYKHDHSDLTCEDFRSRDLFWDQCRHAMQFFRKYLPYWEMEPRDDLVGTGYCYASPGTIYAVYIPEGGTADLTLSSGEYSVKWYNPREGGDLLEGSKEVVKGCGKVNIGKAPADEENDWVAIVKNTNLSDLNACGDEIVFHATEDFRFFRNEGYAPAYKDEGTNALAINASSFAGQTAIAIDTFIGNSGYYNVELTTLAELDGESTYKVIIGDEELCSFTNPETETDYAKSGQVWTNIYIEQGMPVKVEFNSVTNGKIPENDTTAFSRGRWTKLSFQPLCNSETYDSKNKYYIEEDGKIIIEPENGDISGNWIIHKNTGLRDFINGFTGEGCLQFTGNTEVSGPVNSILTYTFKIDDPGKYKIAVRGLEAPMETGQGDKANDCYLRIEGQEGWYGEFVKWVLLGDSYIWSWNIKGEPEHHSFQMPVYKFGKGIHRLQIAGRSKNFFIDRIVIYRSNLDEDLVKTP